MYDVAFWYPMIPISENIPTINEGLNQSKLLVSFSHLHKNGAHIDN